MCEIFDRIEAQIPKTETSMLNFIKNNESVNKLPNSFDNLKGDEKLMIYKRFARYLINENGIDDIKNLQSGKQMSDFNLRSNNASNGINIDTSDMPDNPLLRQAFTVASLLIFYLFFFLLCAFDVSLL